MFLEFFGKFRQTVFFNKFPAEIGNLEGLINLYVYQNKLTTLPPEISQLANLKVLYLYGNKLTSIPSELGALINLDRMDLRWNSLTSVPKGICDLGTVFNVELQLDKDVTCED